MMEPSSPSPRIHNQTDGGTRMRPLALSCLLLSSAVAMAQSVHPIKQVDDSHYEMDFRRHGEVRMHIQPSDLRISGSDEEKIKVHYWSNRDDSSDVKVRLESSDRKSTRLNSSH